MIFSHGQALLEAEDFYSRVADEYYDLRRHPTCASFRELSELYLRRHLALEDFPSGLILEVGTGLSIMAPMVEDAGTDMGRLVLSDNSEAMLSHSANWFKCGARALIAKASDTNLPNGSVQIAVGSLGDPYNTPEFWQEVARVLVVGGMCHFTTPAYEWSSSFRDEDGKLVAEFETRDGLKFDVPSFVYPFERQRAMIEAASLEVVHSEHLSVLDLSTAPAPKLLCVPSGTPVVTGYSVRPR